MKILALSPRAPARRQVPSKAPGTFGDQSPHAFHVRLVLCHLRGHTGTTAIFGYWPASGEKLPYQVRESENKEETGTTLLRFVLQNVGRCLPVLLDPANTIRLTTLPESGSSTSSDEGHAAWSAFAAGAIPPR
jgi:hypothetical protein